MPRTQGKVTPLIRMEIQTVVMGGFQMSSLIVLKNKDASDQQVHLPIRIGPVEAAAITAGIESKEHERPLTHQLMAQVISGFGGRLVSVSIDDVKGTTFFATLHLIKSDGLLLDIDCRPSDAIALAVRERVPIFARKQVIETATMPDFQKVKKDTEKQEMEAFHEFVESLSPEDFTS